MLSQHLQFAFARLDKRLEAVATQQERRSTLLAGDGASGWDGVRNLARADLKSLFGGGFSDALAPNSKDNPITRLTRRLGLAQNATDLLLMLLAPWVEPRYGTLFALLQDDPHQPQPTERLLYATLTGAPGETEPVADLLRVGSALRSTGTIIPVPGQFAPLGQPYALPPDVVAVLLERRKIDIGGASDTVWKQGQGGMDKAFIGDVPALGTNVFFGSAGLRTAALSSFSRQEMAGVVCFDGDLDAEAARQTAAVAWRVAMGRGDGLVFDLRSLDEGAAASVAQLVARRGAAFGGAVRLLARRPLPVRLPHHRIAAPDWQARIKGWQAIADHTGHAMSRAQVEQLAARHLPTDQLRADIIAAAQAAPETDLAELVMMQRRNAPRHAVQRDVRMTFDDLVLRATTRKGLERLAYFVTHRTRLSGATPGHQHFQLENGPVALFHGLPGTGKTIAAEAVADRLGCPFYVVDLSQVVSKYVGETEKHIHDTLMEAEANGALLFFDEADALFSRRVEKASSGGEQFSNMVMGYLLQRIEAHHGPIVLATNLAQGLDEALMRRFRFRVEFPLPDPGERTRLWQKMLGEDTALDLQALGVRHKLSGGEIRNAALKAVFLADERGAELTPALLDEAVKMELLELGRLAREQDNDAGPMDAGQVLRSTVVALETLLETHLRAVFAKDIHIVIGPPTERVLSGKRPALSLAMYRVAGRRGGDGLRTGFVLSTWCARPEEEHDILGVVHGFLASQPLLPGGNVKLRLQESHDFEMLQRFWSSHDQPMKPALVLEAELPAR